LSLSCVLVGAVTAEDSSGNTGLLAAIGIGVVLLAVSLWMRGNGKYELKIADVGLGALPFLIWMLWSGQISKLGFAGMEIEVRDAILDAASAPVSAQVKTLQGVVEEIAPGEREEKGGSDLLPALVEARLEALEFRLGRGSYYVGDVIKRYLDTLSPTPFFKYVLVFDEQNRLFGMFTQRELVDALNRRAGNGHDWFAKVLNRGGAEAGAELAGISGFVPGEVAVTPQVDKRKALEEMERIGSSILPVVNPESREFIGVVERSRLTASLILDIAGDLERTK
jgi:CBS domain-containing protein